ncbi:MAG: 1-acyl-sn-glycerol-3-phosphate acyltransferase [Bacteroidetes bacterium]|nr:1-acyl-sn-glycerol-3-phosphate acyltransferase [Bacteroidota bacterium]
MLSNLLYVLLRGYVRVAMHGYFSRIRIEGRENVPSKGPVLFAANHQNSFLDGVIIACTQPRILHFLVRADVFRKSWARKCLTLLKMVPVYRIRDGWNTLGQNSLSFSRCKEVFLKGKSVLIFPEGNHSNLRRLRPLSRGFTKPIIETLQQNPQINIAVVPVGLNFEDHEAPRTGITVVYGKPLWTQDYFFDGKLDANRLRDDLANLLSGQITDIGELDRYQEVEQKLVESGEDFLDPDRANQKIKVIMEGGVLSLQAVQTNKIISDQVFRRVNWIPLAAWGWTKAQIKDPMFLGSIKFVFGVFGFPAIYFAIYFLLSQFNAPMALIVIMIMAFAALRLRKRTD